MTVDVSGGCINTADGHDADARRRVLFLDGKRRGPVRAQDAREAYGTSGRNGAGEVGARELVCHAGNRLTMVNGEV